MFHPLFVTILVPVIGLVQVGGQARADRYLYLPMIGLGIAAAWGAPLLAGRLRLPRPALAAGALAALAAFGLAAAGQAEHWRTNETLFRHALAVTRENWVAHSYLGAGARTRGDKQAAVGHYREAVRINPSSADMRYNLALTLADAGRAADSAREFRMAVHLNPSKSEARYQLAVSLARSGQHAEARSTA